ncbi:hypothetical protein F6V25_08015 [Oryzomonas japonica]|uniref:Uncharacterized protein n=1 Tax=Oryzomonas japonica TaxID=2603858 RepID=A0A7J4ZR70_9BACT|nr:glycosyl hydrolase 108 family protein [Oryzomonas japonica]KAB0665658.1 hypothetical protein F6V25_08015 [Oryzomonas japonica]
MTDFNAIHAATMGYEGGASFNPADKGNVVDKKGIVTLPTYKGIAPAYWPAWGGWKYIAGVIALLVPMPEYGTTGHSNWVRHLNGKLTELAALQQMVVDFYRKNFWDANRLGEITDSHVAAWIYDHVVNAGPRGVMWAQLAAKVKPDGKIGPASLAAINSADPAALLERMEDIAGEYRLDKAHDNPSQVQFLVSWLRRDGQPESIIAMVHQAAVDGKLSDSEMAAIKATMEATA